MREILYKGKPKNELIDWVYGYYFYSELTCKHCIMGESKDYGYNCIEVIPETVGQYTGLKDKNGTKIFEGDIIRVFDVWCGGVKKVVWWESEASFKLSKDGKTYLCLDTAIEKGCKVIGNIHDNPELLNAED